ncbi:hypothetical protein [Amycolatopsis sp. NPDC004079]|uniref:hypothetical protein n=1 Tax=Amycolatopsis sp. NPDC004079 TaxID=3154549 RepID=UPI0033BAFC9E
MVHLLDRPQTASDLVFVHAVGSAPATSGSQWHLDHRCGAQLLGLPCPEPRNWVVDWLKALEFASGIRKVRAGDCRGYDQVPCYAPEDGVELDPASLALGRPSLVEEAIATRDQLVGDAIPERLQVSIPNALDLAYFASGSVEAAPQWLPALQTMLAGEIAEIDRRWRDQVLLQLESPAILMSYHQTPREAWAELTEQLVAQVASVLAVAPRAAWVLHLCYGDLEHQPVFTPTDLDAPVMFLRALAQRLTALGIEMPIAHIPVAYGDAAPPVDPAYYEVLRQLRESGIRVVAGVVAEHHPEASAMAASLIAEVLGDLLAAVAAACGLGRRTPEDAAASHRLSARIAELLNARVRRPAAA